MIHKRKPIHIVNLEIGQKIQELRLSKGLSREQLASKINLTHQGLERYEKGKVNIAVYRLVTIAEILEQPIDYFLNGAVPKPPTEHETMTMQVSRNFLKIRNRKHRIAVNNFVRILAGGK